MFTRKISVAGIICFLLCCAIEFQAQTVRINEIMASNSTTLADKDGDFPDWIELYNYGTEAVKLQSWALTDDINVPNKWVFPDTTLQANQYLIVFASSKNKKNEISKTHSLPKPINACLNAVYF